MQTRITELTLLDCMWAWVILGNWGTACCHSYRHELFNRKSIVRVWTFTRLFSVSVAAKVIATIGDLQEFWL